MNCNNALPKGYKLQGGKYIIESSLGQGSFGITYLATLNFTTVGALGTMEVKSEVAIKEFFMSDVNVRNANGSKVEGSTGTVFTNYRRKFRKEAENLSKLSHPNIVKVYDIFDENGTTYYVMEHIDGINLDDFVKENILTVSQVVEIAREVGEALSYMHSKKMLHLDLKPKNIMHSKDGKNVLIDFGLSKQYTENGEPESSTTIGLGTPGYAPIEQSQYKQDGTFPATLDIYAFGATLYKLITGQRPTEASQVLNEGLGTIRIPNCERMAAIIKKAMSPVKKDRYQTVEDFLHAIKGERDTIKKASTSKRNNKESNEDTVFQDQEDFKRSYNWLLGLVIAIIGIIFIICMQSEARGNGFSDLDGDGLSLAFFMVL